MKLIMLIVFIAVSIRASKLLDCISCRQNSSFYFHILSEPTQQLCVDNINEIELGTTVKVACQPFDCFRLVQNYSGFELHPDWVCKQYISNDEETACSDARIQSINFYLYFLYLLYVGIFFLYV